MSNDTEKQQKIVIYFRYHEHRRDRDKKSHFNAEISTYWMDMYNDMFGHW